MQSIESKYLSSGLAISAVFIAFLFFFSSMAFSSNGGENASQIAIEKAKALGVEPGTLEKTVFIHYANGAIKPAGAKSPSCYKLLGSKWKTLPLNYYVNPAGSAPAKNFAMDAIAASASEWDIHTGAQLFGAGIMDNTANWDGSSPDGRVEYSWGDYPEAGVIAVTVIWTGIPIGGKGRQIIDADVMFDTNYAWGDATANTSVVDLQNIATHETGHVLGLGDVYDALCGQATMYGYSGYGETIKRTLEQPDINGLVKLYGA